MIVGRENLPRFPLALTPLNRHYANTNMYGEPHVDRLLPREADMEREDALDAFLAVINTAKPDHPYFDDPYPLTRDDVDYGVTRRYSARCGPRRHGSKAVYSTRMTHIREISREEHLALLTHESTHIVYGTGHGRQSGSHPPEFWRDISKGGN